jgi:acetylornithine deacetylase/succinyl-diaminopimelate desuccinylase
MEDRLHEFMAGAVEHVEPEEVIELARQLVRVPSHTPEGEVEAAALLEHFFQQAGIPTTRQGVDEFGVNVIAMFSGKKPEVGLLFNGHLDVVPPSSAMSHPPFDAIVESGRLWGRGAADMKAGLAAMSCALAAIRRAGYLLEHTLILSAVASEEQGCRGTARLIHNGLRARWAVVGEPTGLDLVIAHKGVDRYQVVVEGRSAHESMPELGLNAIVHAARLINALDTHLLSAAGPPVHPMLGHATYNIGTIEGGLSRNMVPDHCMFRVSKRWLPGDSPEAILAEIEAALAAAGSEARVSVVQEADVQRVPRPPLELRPDHALTRTLAQTVTQMTGRPPALRGWAAYSDGGLLQMAGIPTLVFGPGELQLAHSDQEHVQIDEVVTAAKLYTAFAVVACAANDLRERGQGGQRLC